VGVCVWLGGSLGGGVETMNINDFHRFFNDFHRFSLVWGVRGRSEATVNQKVYCRLPAGCLKPEKY
jgi:hypothetical protein